MSQVRELRIDPDAIGYHDLILFERELNDAEYRALRESFERQGWIDRPIYLSGDASVAYTGRHRIRACHELGMLVQAVCEDRDDEGVAALAQIDLTSRSYLPDARVARIAYFASLHLENGELVKIIAETLKRTDGATAAGADWIAHATHDELGAFVRSQKRISNWTGRNGQNSSSLTHARPRAKWREVKLPRAVAAMLSHVAEMQGVRPHAIMETALRQYIEREKAAYRLPHDLDFG